jgi:bifunctional DNA-binding transcriptional regulator/antitoxin component of YhaV-PrlF toxin-antitoxin module
MREITTELKIDKSGRIVIPEIYRQELKIQPGQLVKITISNPLEKDN